MDVESCVKAVVIAANQYRGNPEGHQVQLQRQLDILVGLASQGKCAGFFKVDQMLPTDCLVALTNVLNNKYISNNLAEKVILLLTHLAEDEEVRKMLHCTFNITSNLAGFLMSSDLSDAMTVECVRLMQQITYRAHVSFQDSYMEDLLRWLKNNIQGKPSDLTQPCLGLMANFCRENFSIQMYLKNMDGFKSFCKTLVANLNRADQKFIFSLSILANLCMNEEYGAMLFRTDNMHQSFQLIFNIVNGDANTARRYAVDLFSDLLKYPKIQNTLINFKVLEPVLKQIFTLICSPEPDIVAKVLELLLTFCNVNRLRGKVVKCLLELCAAPAVCNTNSNPLFAVIHWASQNPEAHSSTPLLALDFTREVYEECIDSNKTQKLTNATEKLLPLVTRLLKDGAKTLTLCRRADRVVKLLLTFCSSDELMNRVSRDLLRSGLCCQIIEDQMNNHHLHTSQISPINSDACELEADLVIHTLQLMVKLKFQSREMDTDLKKLLQDTRLVAFLAYCIKSTKMERLNTTLKLMSIALPLEDFPLAVLADSLVASNSDSNHKRKLVERAWQDRGDEVRSSVSGKMEAPPPLPMNSSAPNTSTSANTHLTELDSSVQSLIDRMQTGLELKDVRVSEIISVYEHRLQSLQTKEDHLQDLLETKARALCQADQLISQYRCQRVQAESENHKLRTLLRDFEAQSEGSREKVSQLQAEKEQLQTQLEELDREYQRLEEIAEEHSELSEKFVEQTKKLENSQRSLTTLKQEHKSLTEMHEMLKRHNDSLKEQNDVASQHLVELEENLQTVSQSLKDRDAKNQELSKALKKTQQSLEVSNKEREDLEVALDSLRASLASTTEQQKQLQVQVNSLEILCRQHESNIKEKDTLIRNQKAELEKHAQFKNMIQNLVN